MDTNQSTAPTKAGTIGGTLLAILLHIQGEELLKTALYAATGAIVSYISSLGIKWVIRRIIRKQRL